MSRTRHVQCGGRTEKLPKVIFNPEERKQVNQSVPYYFAFSSENFNMLHHFPQIFC